MPLRSNREKKNAAKKRDDKASERASFPPSAGNNREPSWRRTRASPTPSRWHLPRSPLLTRQYVRSDHNHRAARKETLSRQIGRPVQNWLPLLVRCSGGGGGGCRSTRFVARVALLSPMGARRRSALWFHSPALARARSTTMSAGKVIESSFASSQEAKSARLLALRRKRARAGGGVMASSSHGRLSSSSSPSLVSAQLPPPPPPLPLLALLN